MTTFRNPQNGHEMRVSSAMTPIWAALFGFAYWIWQGVWAHAMIALMAYGFFALVDPPFMLAPMAAYAVAARGILDRHYLARGWSVVGAARSAPRLPMAVAPLAAAALVALALLVPQAIREVRDDIQFRRGAFAPSPPTVPVRDRR